MNVATKTRPPRRRFSKKRLSRPFLRFSPLLHKSDDEPLNEPSSDTRQQRESPPFPIMSSLSPVNKSLQKELPLPPRVSSIHLEKGNKDGWVAIELNNYSSDITQTDVAEVFTNFQVEEFRIPDFKKFHMPLRMRLQVKGEKEAERAIRELSGKVVHGRSIGIDRLQDPRSDTNSDARNWGHTEHSHAISNKQHDAE